MQNSGAELRVHQDGGALSRNPFAHSELKGVVDHLFALGDLLDLLLAQSSSPTEEAFLEGAAVVKGQNIERFVVSNLHVSSRISVSLLFLPTC